MLDCGWGVSQAAIDLRVGSVTVTLRQVGIALDGITGNPTSHSHWQPPNPSPEEPTPKTSEVTPPGPTTVTPTKPAHPKTP